MIASRARKKGTCDEAWWESEGDGSSPSFLSLLSSPLQTGLGQTAGGAQEKPGQEISKSPPLTLTLHKHGGTKNPKFYKVSAGFHIFSSICGFGICGLHRFQC